MHRSTMAIARGITGAHDQSWSRTDLEAIGDINEDGFDDIRIGEEIKDERHRRDATVGRRPISNQSVTSTVMAT